MNQIGSELQSSVVSAAERVQLTGKRVVAVQYSSYLHPRPRMAAETLAEEGATVELICLKGSEEEPEYEFLNGVHVTRIPMQHLRGGKLSYLLRYGRFILISGWILAVRGWKRRYDLVHVHNMPDILVFSAAVPKLLGAKIILDLHDPMPELMVTIFGLPQHSYWVRLLMKFEKWSIGFAHAVLTVNEACKKVFSARSCPPQKITVVMNSPYEGVFRDREPSRENLTARDPSKPFLLMYNGSLVERHGLDLAVMALGKIRSSIPNAQLRVYGRSTPFLCLVMESVEKSTLRDAVRYLGPRNLEGIAEAIAECDLGIIPNRRSTFTEINTPTRIFEFLSQGKPVIAPRVVGILDYFSPEELLYFNLGDADDLAAKIEYVFQHPEEIVGLVERGRQVYQRHKWKSERLHLMSLARRLLNVATQSMHGTEEYQA
jgi:glycosyltransferase involved in cell wall biosynthesis